MELGFGRMSEELKTKADQAWKFGIEPWRVV